MAALEKLSSPHPSRFFLESNGSRREINDTPLVNIEKAIENGHRAIEIVDLAINSMVDLSRVNSLPEGNKSN